MNWTSLEVNKSNNLRFKKVIRGLIQQVVLIYERPNIRVQPQVQRTKIIAPFDIVFSKALEHIDLKKEK